MKFRNEEVRPERLLLHELHARQLRGELNSIDDVRTTFETVMGANFSGIERHQRWCKGGANVINGIQFTTQLSCMQFMKEESFWSKANIMCMMNFETVMGELCV